MRRKQSSRDCLIIESKASIEDMTRHGVR